MASSFIDFKDNGFWARDAFVESFQLLLFEEIQLQYQDRLIWLSDYRKELALQSLPLIYGGMSMRFDETLIDYNRIEIVLGLLDKIRAKIVDDKNYLTGIHLNSLRKSVRHYLVDTGEFEWNKKEIEIQLKNGTYGQLPIEKYKHGFDLLRTLVAGQFNATTDTEMSLLY